MDSICSFSEFSTSCFDSEDMNVWIYTGNCGHNPHLTTFVPGLLPPVSTPSLFLKDKSLVADNLNGNNGLSLLSFIPSSTVTHDHDRINTGFALERNSMVYNRTPSSEPINFLLAEPQPSLKIHHEILPFKCPEERNLENYIHIIPTNEGNPLFKCFWNGCPGITFWERAEINQHVHNHFIQKGYECVCGATFGSQMSARRHCREQGKKNTCPGCFIEPQCELQVISTSSPELIEAAIVSEPLASEESQAEHVLLPPTLPEAKNLDADIKMFTKSGKPFFKCGWKRCKTCLLANI
ncbi:hypothetical protein M422DRAFT_777032 [Sphaerobolus stellatus SS14]|nr:hypothetical protein M422DRAFT_777032 [Sphaerobolus stellatus SS14]